jgi:hypothetical protein
MLDLQHQYNNPSHEGGAHPHVRGCCTVVVLVLYKNQIPRKNSFKQVVGKIIIPKAKWAHGRTEGPVGPTDLARPARSPGSRILTTESYG